MNFTRRFLAFFGLSKDARVNMRTDDIEVTIVGNPKQVQIVLEAVRSSLENILLEPGHARFAEVQDLHHSNTESLVVLPTELDEKDSPYAIPEHRTVAGSDPKQEKDSESAETETPFTDTEPSGESITSPGEKETGGVRD